MKPNAYNQIYHLSNEFSNPARASWLMRDYMKKAIKLSNNTMTKDTMLKFNKSKVGLKDVENIAESVMNSFKSSDKSREAKYDIVKDLMKHKLKDAIKCTKTARTELNISKDNLTKVVSRGTFVRNDFMELVDKELQNVWSEAKMKSGEKVSWNKGKHKIVQDNLKGSFKGVLVGDSELENLETNLVSTEKTELKVKAVVYAGIKIKSNEEDILSFPPDYATFPKVDIEEFDTDMEKCVIKCTWEANKEQRKSEEKKGLEERDEATAEDKEDINILDMKTLDFRNLKPTDLKNNKRIVIPDLFDDPEEIRRNNLKSELKQVVIKYKNNHCDKFGNVIDNNLTETQLRDIKKLKQRIKDEGLTCGETDKTGKLTLDTVDNLSKKMDKHVKDDKVLSDKEVKKIENKLNRHMESWVGILKPGEQNKQIRRVKSNLITKDNQIPILRGTSKDHKEAKDKTAGPDVRPIMGAIVGPNIGLSEIASIIVRKIADDADEGLVSKSTEEVINKFENFNQRRMMNKSRKRKLIIASMDIEKFYQSLLSANSSKIIRKMWETSDLSIQGIDMDKLIRYLGSHLQKEEIIEEGFEEILYTKEIKERKKKSKYTKKISRKHVKNNTKKKDNGKDTENRKLDKNETLDTLDTNGSGGADTPNAMAMKKDEVKDKKKKKTVEMIKPKRNPTKKEERTLFGKALEIMIVTCMDNHIYQFGNKTRIQSQGGPTGLKLTGEIADCIMIDWDKKLLTELKEYKLLPEVYTRFKDDIQIVIESIAKGCRLEDGKIVVEPKGNFG